MCCPLVFEFSVGIGGFVIGLGQISFFFSLYVHIFTDRCKSKLNKQHNMYKLNAFANSWFQSSNREVDITK